MKEKQNGVKKKQKLVMMIDQLEDAIRLAPAPLYTVRDNIKSIAVYSCGWDALGVKFQPTLNDMVESLNSVIRRRFKTLPAVDTFVET